MVTIVLHLDEVRAQRIIDALRSSKGDSGADPKDLALAKFIEEELADERRNAARIAEVKRLEDERRAERARNHTLTDRQAMCLAAFRAGKGPFEYWRKTDGMLGGNRGGYWSRRQNTGGAVRRMLETMEGEGLIRGRTPTPEGLQRLDVYEQRHGVVAPRE